MSHFAANVGVIVVGAVLTGLLAWLARLINKLVGLLPIVTDLVENAQESNEFRVDVDRRLRAHDGQFATVNQRITILETKVGNR